MSARSATSGPSSPDVADQAGPHAEDPRGEPLGLEPLAQGGGGLMLGAADLGAGVQPAAGVDQLAGLVLDHGLHDVQQLRIDRHPREVGPQVLDREVPAR